MKLNFTFFKVKFFPFFFQSKIFMESLYHCTNTSLRQTTIWAMRPKYPVFHATIVSIIKPNTWPKSILKWRGEILSRTEEIIWRWQLWKLALFKGRVRNSSGWRQISCLCKPPTLFWIRVFIVSCGMETMSSQFTKAWPQTDVFNAHSLPRSQTAPQHGAISPQDSQNSSVGAAQHPWVQGQQKPIWKKTPNHKGKEVWWGKMWKNSPDVRGTLELELWKGKALEWTEFMSFGMRAETSTTPANCPLGWQGLVTDPITLISITHIKPLMCTWMQVCINHRDCGSWISELLQWNWGFTGFLVQGITLALGLRSRASWVRQHSVRVCVHMHENKRETQRETKS